MGFDFRMPNIVGNDREQLQQIRSYLYQFIPQLEWALNSINASGSSEYISPAQNREEKPTAATAIDAETAFNVLKPLIIKSADIVTAYYDVINTRLSSVYVAESSFGTYTEKVDKLETETAAFTKTTYEKFEGIESALGDFQKSIRGYIKTGILDEDIIGGDIIGVEIGQYDENGDKASARFTSSKLSFFDSNGDELAYISDYKLYIKNAEVTKSLKVGGIVQKVLTNGDVVEMWEGVSDE